MDKKGYCLPKYEVPSESLEEHVSGLLGFVELLGAYDISTANTRIERYLKYMKALCNSEEFDEFSIFPNAKDGPFDSHLDWRLYVLREVHEILWIFDGLKCHKPKGFEQKLKQIIGGRDFAALDSDTASRNAQFELRIASYFCQSGFDVDLSGITDVVASKMGYTYYIECKRVYSDNGILKRIKGARRQLVQRLKLARGSNCYGVIAIDVTKIAFPHNGLVIGVTPDHTKDIIQAKLKGIRDRIELVEAFSSNRKILNILVQIHICCFVQHPPTPITRFSMCSITNTNSESAFILPLLVLDEAKRVGVEISNRKPRGKRLHVRRKFVFPVGIKIWFDPDVLDLIVSGEWQSPGPDLLKKEVAGIVYKGENLIFSMYEMDVVYQNLTDDDFNKLREDPHRAGVALMMKIYALTFPFDDGCDFISLVDGAWKA